MSDLAKRCEGKWPSILMALGLLDQKALAHKDTACPVCGGKDRFRFGDKGYGAWFCHVCKCGGGGISLVMRVTGTDFKGAAKLIETVIGRASAHAAFGGGGNGADKPKDPLKSWRQATSVFGTPVEAYLRSRGIELTQNEALSLRAHPSLFHWISQSKWPCMVAAVGPAGGPPVTCHQTFLDVGIPAKAPVEKPRLFPAGTPPVGGAWFCTAIPDAEFVVAEGIETTLSAMRLCGALAGCAALSAGGIERLVLPPEARRVRVFADHDELQQGLAGAVEAARRWRSEGRMVTVIMATEAGEDANDVWLRRMRMAAGSEAP
jgi:putative DNA primase/helicase